MGTPKYQSKKHRHSSRDKIEVENYLEKIRKRISNSKEDTKKAALIISEMIKRPGKVHKK